MHRHAWLTAVCLTLALSATPRSAPPPVPAALSALLAAQGVTRSVAGWCRAAFRGAGATGYAVALASADGGGTYVVIEPKTTIVELGRYAGQPSLDCYSRAEADKLDATIQRSTTIHGRVTPRWQTPVVCGFADDTSATCWQHSPEDRVFVEIGRWIT